MARLVAPSLTKGRKGKVVWLHGWAQNAQVMKNKSKSLTRKLNQAGYDCVFLEGPHVLPMTGAHLVEGTARKNARAWFLLSREDPSDTSLAQSDIPMSYIGLDKSLDIVTDELNNEDQGEHEYFVALLGFSHGGVFAHILSTLASTVQDARHNDRHHDCPFRQKIHCVIFASGFASQHVYSAETFEKCQDDGGGGITPSKLLATTTTKLSVPSMHLIGQNDTSVHPELSLKLASMFKDSEILLLEKGHILPQNSSQCAKLISFLNRNEKSNV